MITPIEHWRTLDSKGLMMPWYTRPCLEWLQGHVKEWMRVFEYGCGASTDWYRSVGATVHGVDTNADWARGQRVSTTKEKYVGEIMRYAPFDLVIIDGDFRDDCTEYALVNLKKGGYLIADNFEQLSADLANWPKTRRLTKNLPMTIFKEPTHWDWVTATWHNV